MNGLFSQFSVFSALSGLFSKLGGTASATSLGDSTTLQNMPGQADFAAIMGNLLTPQTPSTLTGDSLPADSSNSLPSFLQSLFSGGKVVSSTLSTADLSRARTTGQIEQTEESTNSSDEGVLDPSTFVYILLPTDIKTAANFQTGGFSQTLLEGDSLPVALVVEGSDRFQIPALEIPVTGATSGTLLLTLASGDESLCATRETIPASSLTAVTQAEWKTLGMPGASPDHTAGPLQLAGFPASEALLERVNLESTVTPALPSMAIRITREAIQQLALHGEASVSIPASDSVATDLDASPLPEQVHTPTTIQVIVPQPVFQLIKNLEPVGQITTQTTTSDTGLNTADSIASSMDQTTSSSGSLTTSTASPGSYAASVHVLLGEVASYLSELHGEITSIQAGRKEAITEPSPLPPAVNTATTLEITSTPSGLDTRQVFQSSTPSGKVITPSSQHFTQTVTTEEPARTSSTAAGQGNTISLSVSTKVDTNTVSTPVNEQTVSSSISGQPVRVLQILRAAPDIAGTPDTVVSGTLTTTSQPRSDLLQSSNYALPASGESFSIRDGVIVLRASAALETAQPSAPETFSTIRSVPSQVDVPLQPEITRAIPAAASEKTGNVETTLESVLQASASTPSAADIQIHKPRVSLMDVSQTPVHHRPVVQTTSLPQAATEPTSQTMPVTRPEAVVRVAKADQASVKVDPAVTSWGASTLVGPAQEASTAEHTVAVGHPASEETLVDENSPDLNVTTPKSAEVTVKTVPAMAPQVNTTHSLSGDKPATFGQLTSVKTEEPVIRVTSGSLFTVKETAASTQVVSDTSSPETVVTLQNVQDTPSQTGKTQSQGTLEIVDTLPVQSQPAQVKSGPATITPDITPEVIQPVAATTNSMTAAGTAVSKPEQVKAAVETVARTTRKETISSIPVQVATVEESLTETPGAGPTRTVTITPKSSQVNADETQITTPELVLPANTKTIFVKETEQPASPRVQTRILRTIVDSGSAGTDLQQPTVSAPRVVTAARVEDLTPVSLPESVVTTTPDLTTPKALATTNNTASEAGLESSPVPSRKVNGEKAAAQVASQETMAAESQPVIQKPAIVSAEKPLSSPLTSAPVESTPVSSQPVTIPTTVQPVVLKNHTEVPSMHQPVQVAHVSPAVVNSEPVSEPVLISQPEAVVAKVPVVASTKPAPEIVTSSMTVAASDELSRQVEPAIVYQTIQSKRTIAPATSTLPDPGPLAPAQPVATEQAPIQVKTVQAEATTASQPVEVKAQSTTPAEPVVKAIEQPNQPVATEQAPVQVKTMPAEAMAASQPVEVKAQSTTPAEPVVKANEQSSQPVTTEQAPVQVKTMPAEAMAASQPVEVKAQSTPPAEPAIKANEQPSQPVATEQAPVQVKTMPAEAMTASQPVEVKAQSTTPAEPAVKAIEQPSQPVVEETKTQPEPVRTESITTRPTNEDRSSESSNPIQVQDRPTEGSPRAIISEELPRVTPRQTGHQVTEPVQAMPVVESETVSRIGQVMTNPGLQNPDVSENTEQDNVLESKPENTSKVETPSARTATPQSSASGIVLKQERLSTDTDSESSSSESIERDQETLENEVSPVMTKVSRNDVASSFSHDLGASTSRADAGTVVTLNAAVSNAGESSRGVSVATEPSPVTESQILDQVVQAARVRKVGTGSEIHVRLRPENLGEVHLKMNMTSQGVVAELSASSMATQEVLSKHAQRIQSVLVDSGLRVDQVVVKAGGMDSSSDFRGSSSHSDSLPREWDQNSSSYSRERGSRDQGRGSRNPFEENNRKGWEKYA